MDLELDTLLLAGKSNVMFIVEIIDAVGHA